MASVSEFPRFTPEQYLALERKASFKSEYNNGFIWAMAGASDEHNTISMNLAGGIWSQLKGRPCKVYGSDMRVCVNPSGLYTYPDVTAVCGERKFLEDKRDTLLNPTMIAEVLSPTTEAYDRGGKFAQFRRLPSLHEYVLIAQDEVLVERCKRKGEEWVLKEFRSLDELLRLESINCEISLRDIYAKVEFSDEPAAGT
jgi:Uma2 family endonuclease